jgi:dipeptidyl aminopeptidase/acylaminoacyl peptidase
VSINKEQVKVLSFRVPAPSVELAGNIFSVDPEKPRPVLLLLHGIPRSKPEPGDEGYAPLARRAALEGFAAVFFNFRGTGESTGNFHLKGWSNDLVAVVDYLCSRPEIDPDRIFAAGFSGGAATAIYTAATDMRLRAVVSVSCPARFDALTKFEAGNMIKAFREIGLFRDPEFPPSLESWKAEFEEMAPIRWVDRVSPRPILLIHGEDDELVPPKHAQQLFAKAGDPKELIWIPGGPHRLRKVPEVIEQILSWLKPRASLD